MTSSGVFIWCCYAASATPDNEVSRISPAFDVEVDENVKAKSSEEGGDALAPPAGFGDLDSPSKKARNNGQGKFKRTCEFSVDAQRKV